MAHHAIDADTRNQLADHIQRIESLTDELTEIKERVKAEFAEAAGAGFDKKAIQQIIKERAADAQKSIEHREIVETYRAALAGLVGTPLGDWARQWVANDSRIKQRSKPAGEEAMDALLAKRRSKSGGDSAPPPAA